MRVLSGIQPSGALHLGNYFGSMRPNLEWQDKAEQSFYFVVDLHALTSVQDRNQLRQSRIDCILDLLACGFDPKKAIIFYQSHIPEHAELMWILSTLVPMGMLERAVSYKDKVSKGLSASVGLFTYPVLMAADILLYDTNLVPVGKDQKQHVEIARDIAIKFNNTYGDVLVVPEPQIHEDVAVVPGTDGQKMSKSYGNTIPLFGDDASIKKSIMGIVTDSKGMNDPKDPETCVIYQMHKLFLSPEDARALGDEYRNGLPYGEGKKRLLSTYMEYFRPMREKRMKLKEKDAMEVAAMGAKRAKSVAVGTMVKVRAAVGLL
ncbi:MAG: tryptophanyl-tRNA synthetase [Candidatus Peregrinibacteria bacterium Greene0416_62]|nr:MAG: tryptophanyl-tRNA synthetase [Candidatus Peregrinibacteria bacterium Greene0416_62]TSD00114.1 MAG: tryptophanyl-tRNA synthetase [Candidatus Peregrinibacteria bacterium Greene1014_49]